MYNKFTSFVQEVKKYYFLWKVKAEKAYRENAEWHCCGQ